jgi:putative sterol carrier protein
MATIEEVKAKLEFLKGKAQGESFRDATEDFNRVVRYDFTDLGYRGYFTIRDGAIEGPHDGEPPSAEISVEMTSETFMGMLNRKIDPFTALVKGQLKIKASFWDMMKLKNLGG